ncbi:MAG: pirin family protein [Bacteroidota bacterium]
MDVSPVQSIKPLGFPWETQDPFLFCVYHADHYPAGNEQLGPQAPLDGRNLGNDFVIKDGWRMYHGLTVPGFPAHPHRGFETITITKKGLVDHSDSMGAAGRFGEGDVQWLTSGKGLQHAEMFPLLRPDQENPLELFQIWINLPKRSKFVDPHFKMLWHEDIPQLTFTDEAGKKTYVEVIAGSLEGADALPPTPSSWASEPENEVAIYTFRMEAGARWTLPPGDAVLNRNLYCYSGADLTLAGHAMQPNQGATLDASLPTEIVNGAEEAYFLLLQGRPINEPVVQYGPFVMNTQEEIRAAMMEFRRNQFGGWPWPKGDMVHEKSRGRFALHADGREEVK